MNEVICLLEGMFIMNCIWFGCVLGIYHGLIIKKEIGGMKK